MYRKQQISTFINSLSKESNKKKQALEKLKKLTDKNIEPPADKKYPRPTSKLRNTVDKEKLKEKNNTLKEVSIDIKRRLEQFETRKEVNLENPRTKQTDIIKEPELIIIKNNMIDNTLNSTVITIKPINENKKEFYEAPKKEFTIINFYHNKQNEMFKREQIIYTKNNTFTEAQINRYDYKKLFNREKINIIYTYCFIPNWVIMYTFFLLEQKTIENNNTHNIIPITKFNTAKINYDKLNKKQYNLILNKYYTNLIDTINKLSDHKIIIYMTTYTIK